MAVTTNVAVDSTTYAADTDIWRGYVPLDASLRVLARLVPLSTPRTIRILNVIRQTEEYA